MKAKQLRLRSQRKSLLVRPGELHPQLCRILAAREVESLDEIDYRLDHLLPLESIRNIDSAANLLLALVQQGKRLLIFGDYDADGATSTALCMRAFGMMGVASVSYLMPDRFIDGYGLSPSIAERIAAMAPHCVITVDNGIASLEGIAILRAKGIEVIVTDHHLPADKLPDASVILNQNAWPDETRGRHLAGVAVVFYLMLALRKVLRENGWFEQGRDEPNLAACLDLVAIGTVADLVPLDFNNRLLVNEGLKRIRANRCCVGVIALIQVAGKSAEHLGSGDIAFGIAPRINAAGRLEDISIGVRCLLAETSGEAMALAQQLDQINQQRKEMQTQMDTEARQQMARIPAAEIESRFGIVLFQPDWHEGIVGIIAARIREKFHRPSIVFAEAEDGLLKGSGRSIRGIHLRDALDRVDKTCPGLIIKFGGHAMAAGLIIERHELQRFEQMFNRVVEEGADPGCFDEIVEYDGELDQDCLALEFARKLESLSPWGQRFPTPSFVGDFEVVEQRVLAEKHLKLRLCLARDPQASCEAIAFFQPATILAQRYQRIRIHYELEINRFRGAETLQLLIRDILS